ncbi:ATP cone domain-containing protein, partial [Tractidigestivibacter sp.]
MQVTKRDGRTEAYDRQKIARAIGKALAETGDPVASDASALEALLSRVEQALVATGATEVEQIQDLVERTLMETGHYDAAKAYILYRHRRAELRGTRRAICALALAEPAG